MRQLILGGILLGSIPFIMGVSCGGYVGWAGLSTSGVDAKITEEVSISSTNPLERGLWTFYTNYNNVGMYSVKTTSTYVDHTAPFATFTSDGLGLQHFNDHVGVQAQSTNDRNKDGIICWIGCPVENGTPGGGDYTVADALCPAVGGTGSTSSSSGVADYCDKANWITLVATRATSETKQTTPGSKFANAQGEGSNFSPVTLGQILASSTLIPGGSGGFTVTINALLRPNGNSHTLSTPITASAYGFGTAIAIDATQAGLKEAASWLAGQWAGLPDGGENVTLTFNGGAASSYILVASGGTAALAMQHYASE